MARLHLVSAGRSCRNEDEWQVPHELKCESHPRIYLFPMRVLYTFWLAMTVRSHGKFEGIHATAEADFEEIGSSVPIKEGPMLREILGKKKERASEEAMRLVRSLPRRGQVKDGKAGTCSALLSRVYSDASQPCIAETSAILFLPSTETHWSCAHIIQTGLGCIQTTNIKLSIWCVSADILRPADIPFIRFRFITEYRALNSEAKVSCPDRKPSGLLGLQANLKSLRWL